MASATGKAVIPLLDLSKYYCNRQAFVEELRQACHSVGFFLIRHNFSEGIAERMLAESHEFFARPTAEKTQISYAKSPSFRGYMPLGVENTAGATDSREQIEWAAEYARPGTRWPLYERLKSTSNPWPTECQPSLQETTLNFTREACHVADCVRDALCMALNLDENQRSLFLSRFEPDEQSNEQPHWVIKLISYPPRPDDNQISQQGVGAHTDTNFLTMVLQDNVGGLQAFSQGEWIDVPSDNGSSFLVCNLGEQAQIWSRGYLLATPHRVLANTSDIPRISVPVFYNPTLSSTIEPLPEQTIQALQWDRAQDYQHWRRNNNTMLASVGENTFKSLARSHHDVFNYHHPDLDILEDGQIRRN